MRRINYLGLDVGTRRIGVAVARDGVKIASCLPTITVDGNEISRIERIVKDYDIGCIIVGYPRNQSGEATQQTRTVEAFVEVMTKTITVPVAFQDESLTSVVAEQELAESGKRFAKGDIDARAAEVLLQDYIETV